MSTSTDPRASTDWDPRSWRDRVALQQPHWPDADAHARVLEQLGVLPPLVFAGESRELTASLAAVAEGKAFLLAGDNKIVNGSAIGSYTVDIISLMEVPLDRRPCK